MSLLLYYYSILTCSHPLPYRMTVVYFCPGLVIIIPWSMGEANTREKLVKSCFVIERLNIQLKKVFSLANFGYSAKNLGCTQGWRGVQDLHEYVDTGSSWTESNTFGWPLTLFQCQAVQAHPMSNWSSHASTIGSFLTIIESKTVLISCCCYRTKCHWQLIDQNVIYSDCGFDWQ